MYEALGLCEEGQGGHLVDSGRWISNSKGGSHVQGGGIVVGNTQCVLRLISTYVLVLL